MDEDTKIVIKQGEDYIELIKNDPVLPLDYKEDTLHNLQTWIECLKGDNFDESYISMAMIGFSVYMGKMIKEKFSKLEFVAVLNNGMLDEIELTDNDGNLLNILSWIKKCYSNPEGNNIVFKYRMTLKILQGQIK